MMGCPCGGEHEPHQCKFLDFADCDVMDDIGTKFWIGRTRDEDCSGSVELVELIGFDVNDGEIRARFAIDLESARELGQALLDAADSRTPRRRDRRGAISAHTIAKFEKQDIA